MATTGGRPVFRLTNPTDAEALDAYLKGQAHAEQDLALGNDPSRRSHGLVGYNDEEVAWADEAYRQGYADAYSRPQPRAKDILTFERNARDPAQAGRYMSDNARTWR